MGNGCEKCCSNTGEESEFNDNTYVDSYKAVNKRKSGAVGGIR